MSTLTVIYSLVTLILMVILHCGAFVEHERGDVLFGGDVEDDFILATLIPLAWPAIVAAFLILGIGHALTKAVGVIFSLPIRLYRYINKRRT